MALPIDDSVLKNAKAKGRFILVVVFILSFFTNLLRLTGPLFMLLIYDRVLTSRSEETLVALFALMVTFLIVMGLFDYTRRRLLARYGAQFQERLEADILQMTTRDKFFTRAYNKPATGLDDLDILRGFFHSNTLITTLDFIWTPMFLLVVFVLHWVIGFVTLTGLAILLFVSMMKTSLSDRRRDNAQTASSKIQALKNMMSSSQSLIRSQEMSASFQDRWVIARRDSRDKAIELNDWTMWFTIVSQQGRKLVQYTVLATGAYLTLKGELTVGAMVACTFLVVRVIGPVEQFFKEFPKLKRAIKAWKRLKVTMADQRKQPKVEDPDAQKPQLTLKTVSVKSPLNSQLLLRGISITIRAGSVLEITGPSGSGKTVFAESLLGLWPRSGGTILYGGANLDRFSIHETNRIFGYVPEMSEFITGTIEENIACLDVKPDREKVVEAAQLAGVHSMISALPSGYETKLDTAHPVFSRGQRSRLAFARALYGDPKVLVIDEPDQWMREALHDRLMPMIKERSKKGMIVIILARNPLDLAVTNSHLLIRNGGLKNIKPVSNITPLHNAKSTAKNKTV